MSFPRRISACPVLSKLAMENDFSVAWHQRNWIRHCGSVTLETTCCLTPGVKHASMQQNTRFSSIIHVVHLASSVKVSHRAHTWSSQRSTFVFPGTLTHPPQNTDNLDLLSCLWMYERRVTWHCRGPCHLDPLPPSTLLAVSFDTLPFSY